MFLCHRSRKHSLTTFLTQASLEKQIKELNVRIVDLETRSYASPPRHNTGTGPRRIDGRIEELTNQLQQTNKRESVRHRGPQSASPQDSKSQLAETERQRAKAETYESQIQNMRQTMDAMVC
jgi:myosin protein heavy chain